MSAVLSFGGTWRLSEQVVRSDVMHNRQWECDCEVQASIAWLNLLQVLNIGYVIPNPICC
jgi:hypothetical protein